MAKTVDKDKADYSTQISQMVKFFLDEGYEFEAGGWGIELELFGGRVRFNKDGTFNYEK